MSSKELEFARELVGSAIYAPDHYLDVITLACAATYRIDDLRSAPRILALGLQGSGKSTLLTVASYLASHAGPPTGVLGMTAPSYVAEYRMEPHWTPCIDEINHLFGEAGSSGGHSKFYTYLNQGYLRATGYAQHQENKVRMRIPIFGIAFLAGRGLACPPDLRDRSIILKMKAAGKHVEVADFSDDQVCASFTYAGLCLESWMRTLPKLNVTRVKGLHPDLVHRKMEVWGPLLTVALEADEGTPDVWTKRTLTAFERIEMDAGIPVYTPDVQVLLDYAQFAEISGEEGIASGEFAMFAYGQEHGAYLGMKPGQFKQFAVRNLGTTVPFYRAADQKMVRGWSDTKHAMNLDRAHQAIREAEEAANAETAPAESWDDF